MHHRAVYKLIVIACLLACSVPCGAQDTLSSVRVEQQSYALYSQKSWTELERFGHSALAKGYDYYYLRLRMGIAFYAQRNYLLAEKHFQKALSFNAGDPLALEYLYGCYVYMGKSEEARALSKSFPKELAHQLGTDTLSPVEFILLEGGLKSSDSSRLYQNAYYFQVGFGHSVKNRFSLFHALTVYNETDLVGKTSQLQYYLRATVPLKNNWMIAPAFQLITRNFTPTPGPPANGNPPPWHGGPMPPPPLFQPPPQAMRSNYFITSVQVRKTVSTFDLVFGTSYSNIESKGQVSHSLGFTWYPFGNCRLSASCLGYLYTADGYGTFHSAVNPCISLCPLKRLTLSAAYLSCNGANLIEGNGYIVNNRPDPTFGRWSYLASLSLSRHVDLYGLYQIEDKRESSQDFVYHYNLFLLGIKIKP